MPIAAALTGLPLTDLLFQLVVSVGHNSSWARGCFIVLAVVDFDIWMPIECILY